MIKIDESEKLTYCTIRLECYKPSGEISVGTAFFHHFTDDGRSHLPCIVTNKHVVEDTHSVKFFLNVTNSQSEVPIGKYELKITDSDQIWTYHPDPEIDLCVAPITPIIHELKKGGLFLFYTALSKELIPTNDEVNQYTAIEDIIMVGYPNGVWDEVNNKPVLRKGITATHPRLDYRGKPFFLIDASTFPGSSGSPVFLYQQGTIAKLGQRPSVRIMLLGVLFQGFQHSITGTIKTVDVPIHPSVQTISNIPNNLGIVVKSQKLFDFDSLLSKKYSKGV